MYSGTVYGGPGPVPSTTPHEAPQVPEVVMDSRMIAKKKRRAKEVAVTMRRNAGQVIHTISFDSILPVTADIMWDCDPELLCSYNWQSSVNGTNVIFVPGAPPKWTPPTLPYTLALDSGIMYTDHNYARQPRFPYTPMFEALSVMNPDAQLLDIDVIADRNNLRTLLEFAQGKAGTFRLNLQQIGNTLILVRSEDRYWKRSNGQGYGHNFENHFTQAEEGMQNATSQYRVIRYPMGPLNVVVRFEADAYYEGPEAEVEAFFAAEATPAAPISPVTGGAAAKPNFNYSAPIQVIRRGLPVPCAQIAELKTSPMGESVICMDQLWFGRTPHLLLGNYKKGTGIFQRVRYTSTRDKVAEWERRQQESLRRLVALLIELRRVLRAEQGPIRAAVLVREEKGGPIHIRAMEVKAPIVALHFIQRHWQPQPPVFRHVRPT
ncbi:hypothetical protein K505DRAFT_344104 [Melanomma pulvis-pyrius CBS 109.77]|uniref:Geranylgeranyl pyrophosphate synthetase n=1 Tax=Melanomma pulvis-pyrius CBS 109.77 TaxID=1314802 RepID=A0A6A6WPR4_9PLEO|nr:hypothetical protein K505DRAFT_344104 [Melanomma pulvis-pyrius CBS 109.77]